MSQERSTSGSEFPILALGLLRHPPLTIDLPSLFRRHQRAHISFSGGKDSIVVADLCKPWRDQVTLVWSNTGIMWPHMVEFVRGYAKHFKLIEAAPKPDFAALWRERGYPADVVPVDNFMGRRSPRLFPWIDCCRALRTLPVEQAALADGATAILHGQRLSDRPYMKNHQNLTSPAAAHIEVAGPIWDWTDADVTASSPFASPKGARRAMAAS